MKTITLTKEQERIIRYNEYERYLSELYLKLKSETDTEESWVIINQIDAAQAVWGFMHDPIEEFWADIY